MSMKSLRAVVGGALEEQRLGARSKLPEFMPHGQKYKDMWPGHWQGSEDALGLPPDCPVQPLGFEGENYFFVDANGQLFATGDKAFGRERVAKAFGQYVDYLYWAWPRLKMVKDGEPPLVTGWKPELVTEAMFVAASKKGPWRDFEKVRGLGAWRSPDGELILHRGDFLFYRGKCHHAGVELDGHFYPRRPALPKPVLEPVADSDDVAENLFRFFSTWNWKRERIDPLLLIGWLGAAMLGGALDWRPSMFFVGDKGTGKSTLQDAVKQLLGAGMISTPDTTPAGIYQRIRNDALPIAVDEIEAEADNKRAMGVIKLARLAASGGLMLRGGSDSVGVEFQARSCFLFSAIVPPPMMPQDLSRIALLTLGKLDTSQQRPTLQDPADVVPRLLRRLADRWGSFHSVYQAYRDALRAGGHDSRGQDTYGTFLACAHLLLGEEGLDRLGFPYEDLSAWGELLEAASLPERENAAANWRGCLAHLLSAQVQTWKNGERSNVGRLLEDLAAKADDDHSIDFTQAKRLLALTGLGLVEAGKATVGRALAIPNSSPLVANLYRGTQWGGEGGTGSWSHSLKQGPPNVISSDAKTNKIKLNGQSMRCVMVDLEAFDAWNDVEG